MGLFQNFGTKATNAFNFGRKVVGKGLAFGSKVAKNVANVAQFAATNGDKILSLAEVIPGVRAVDAPLRSALGAAQSIANNASKAADVLSAGAYLAGNRRDGIERGT